MSCYDDNPLTTSQQYEEDCRLGLGHLAGKAGERELCPKCKGSDPARRSFMAESWESVAREFGKTRSEDKYTIMADFGRLVAKVTLEEAADYVSQHDNCGDIASKEIRDLFYEAELLAAIHEEIENAKEIRNEKR